MMLSVQNDKSIMLIAKNDFKGTYIHFPDAQTCRFHSYYQNLTMAGHIMDPYSYNKHYFRDLFEWALITSLTNNHCFP